MLRVSQLLITGLAIILAPGLQADCIYPEDIVIPDGANSTYEEMSESQLFVKEYMAEMEAYLDCLEQEKSAETDSPASDLTNNLANQADQLQHTEQRHTAIDAMESVAASFNEQVRAFKKANP